jgi:hypothetical protein
MYIFIVKKLMIKVIANNDLNGIAFINR